MILLKFLIIYLPFEEFILKWMPVSDQVYLLLRQVPDLTVFCLMVALFISRISLGKGIPIIGSKVDIFLLFFVGWALFTLLLNPSADYFVGLANIKALLRYVFLIYIILMLNPSSLQIENLMTWFSFAIGIQILVGLSQYAGGIPIRDFLAARHVSEDIGGISKDFTGDRFEGVNDLMGTMGDTISFAYFLMVGVTVRFFLFSPKTFKFWGIVALIFLLVYLSGSRAVTLVSLMIISGFIIWKHGWRISIMWGGVFVTVIVVFWFSSTFVDISMNEVDRHSFWFIFNAEFMEGALNSRLGIIVYIVPKILFTVQNVIGFSPDKEFFAEYIAISHRMIPQILVVLLPKVLEDVYWVAIYVYYGLIGFILWVSFLIALFRKINKSLFLLSASSKGISIVAISLILASIPLNFLNQAFETRIFSFYLWLFCGIALSMARQALRVSVLVKLK